MLAGVALLVVPLASLLGVPAGVAALVAAASLNLFLLDHFGTTDLHLHRGGFGRTTAVLAGAVTATTRNGNRDTTKRVRRSSKEGTRSGGFRHLFCYTSSLRENFNLRRNT